ncbi:hypothetical protein Tco_1477689, partial [Tanacetum coccineum]
YEIERLTRLGDGDKANISNDSHVLRLKASKSGPLNKHAEERENFHAVISTPRAFEEDVPSPILLAKPRFRGRTTMYRMAHSPYYRGRSTLSKKPTPSLIYSQPAWELEGSNGSKKFDAGKRRSYVLDDLGSGGPMRRIRQKADLCSQGSSLSKHKSEFDSSAIVENGETRMRNSGYGFVPIKSTQMASKILEHLERTSPKEKPSSSRLAGTTEKLATKLTSNLAQGAEQNRDTSMHGSGSGGPLRRTRQKANLLTLRDKRELGCTALQQPDHASQKLLLMNEPEPKIVKGAEQNRDTSMHGSGSVSGYANVPTKSTQTATKILQHLEKMDLKEKSSGSTKSPTKLSLDMLH